MSRDFIIYRNCTKITFQQTIPFFATDSLGTHDYDTTVPNGNIRTITIPSSGGDTVWAYYGCFLDVYNASHNSKFPGTHHCIVAQIAYDDSPIINSGGVTMSPENSDKLAQRNLQITTSGNPGPPSTHLIPQTFDMRPSQPFEDLSGNIITPPDELMIDWGNTPVGSTAYIYWPQAAAADILALASKLYRAYDLSIADANTIQCPVVNGSTYIPIPSILGINFAGLFSIQLPLGVTTGQEFNILVRRIVAKTAGGSGGNKGDGSRYVAGTFQVKIPVSTEPLMLAPEENTLAIMKWRFLTMPSVYRWYPIMARYINYISARVDGCGGDSESIAPSEFGIYGDGGGEGGGGGT